jgi:hypothetical protein
MDLTFLMDAVIIGLTGWTLLEVHRIGVSLAVLAEQRADHERRIRALEERSLP